MTFLVWACIIAIFALPVAGILLGVSALRAHKRQRIAAEQAAEQERQFLASLTPYEREMYRLAKEQAEATRRAGLGIAAVIAFGGIDHE